MLAPDSWDRTGRNLPLALIGSIQKGDHWARSRQLRFIRYVHRLDAPTTGVLLMVKSPGAVNAYSELFQSRAVEKTYLAVVDGKARAGEWSCATPLARDPAHPGLMIASPRHGEPAETHFRTLISQDNCSLVEARPVTGRTHQIRVHLASSGLPVVGDELYGKPKAEREDLAFPLGLRAVSLSYRDPFRRQPVRIIAPVDQFLGSFGLARNLWNPPRR